MNKTKWILLLLLIALIVPARVVGVDQFATYDEPWWIISGSNFYYALTHRQFEHTVYDYHPAVTTMWVVTTGMVSYFPQYRVFNQGYFDVRKPLFENFMRAKGMDTLPLIRNSRLIQIALVTALALLCFFLLQLLIDEKAAFLAIVLAMDAPFFTGMSRVLNHEALLAMFSLATLLALLVYVNKERKLIYLLVSGVMFGLAQLTKSSSIVLLPLVGLVLVVGLFKRDEKKWTTKFWDAVKTFLIWLITALLVYVVLWPGMWIAPGKMLYEVYGNAFSYALEGSRLDVTQNLQPEKFSLATGFDGVRQYLGYWIDFSTPVSWLGLILVLLIFLMRDKTLSAAPLRSTLVYLLLLAVLYMLLFGFAHGRDSPHYVLTSFVSLDLIAGIGWAYLILWAQKNWVTLNRAYFFPLILILLTGIQLGSGVPYYPYYYDYQNPLVAKGGVHGYGEGLDVAAQYLGQKPNAENSFVIAYAGRGCFSYFYPGRTEHMKVGLKDGLPFVEEIKDADYLVLYVIRQKDRADGAALIRYLQNITPERVITIDGIEYIRIYKVADFPKDIYRTLSSK